MYYSLLLRPLNNGRLEAAMRAPLTAELKLILNAFSLAPDITYEDVFGIRSLGFESAALSPECINARKVRFGSRIRSGAFPKNASAGAPGSLRLVPAAGAAR